MSKHFIYCPDCGFNKEAETFENAFKGAKEHNEKCRPARPRRNEDYERDRD